MAPVAASSVSPAGKAPEVTAYVAASTPVANTPSLYACAVSIRASVESVNTGVAKTVPVSARSIWPSVFVAVITKLYAPPVVGVPVMAPVVALSASPAGSPAPTV